MSERIDFDRTVAGHVASEGVTPPSDAFFDQLLSRAGHTRQRPLWLALIKEPPMRISSSLAVGSPRARVVAIMVATLLLVLMVAGAGIAGSQLLTPSPDDETAFPTGTFVAAEWSNRFVEFNQDGTCRWAHIQETPMDCTYAVDGDLYTETSYESDDVKHYPPATYHWEYDGEYLTFELRGEDPHVWRRAIYQEQPYRHVPDPRLVVLAAFDIAAGTELLTGHMEDRVVPGDQVPSDALTDRDLVASSVAAVAITKGQPITPDLLAVE